MSLPESKRSAAEPQPNRGTAILAVIELQGVGGRLAAPWFRIHPAERRVGQARHLVIAFTRSNGA